MLRTLECFEVGGQSCQSYEARRDSMQKLFVGVQQAEGVPCTCNGVPR